MQAGRYLAASFDQCITRALTVAMTRTQAQLMKTQPFHESIRVGVRPHHLHQLDQLPFIAQHACGSNVVVAANRVDRGRHALAAGKRQHPADHVFSVVIDDVASPSQRT